MCRPQRVGLKATAYCSKPDTVQSHSGKKPRGTGKRAERWAWGLEALGDLEGEDAVGPQPEVGPDHAVAAPGGGLSFAICLRPVTGETQSVIPPPKES